MNMRELIESVESLILEEILEEEALDRMGVPRDPDNRAARRFIDALKRSKGDHEKALKATERRVKATKDREKLLGIALYMELLHNQMKNWKTWAKSADDPRVMSKHDTLYAKLIAGQARDKAEGM